MSSATTSAAPANTFKGFWMTHHNLRRHPFAAPGTPAKTTDEPRRVTAENAWASLKEFFQMRQKFGRHPFDIKV